MLDLLRHWAVFRLDRRGVTALEYALIAGVLGALLVTGFTKFGGQVSSALGAIGSSIQ